MRTLITSATIIDPSQQLERMGDILIDDGCIQAILEPNSGERADRVIEAAGLVAAPGLVDIHVHFRDPGYTYKEDIHSGCESAAAGGFTAVACMPNTNPVADNAGVICYMLDMAATAKAKLLPIAAMTIGQMGEQLCDYHALKEAGAYAVSDDGAPVRDEHMMADVIINADTHGLLPIEHCEDLDETAGGRMNAGPYAEELGVKGINNASEANAVKRDIALSRATGKRVHLAHISTKESIDAIRHGRRDGTPFTCETCPHYFMFTDADVAQGGPNFLMNPPLRSEADKQAVLAALKDGVFDCIVTDHAPHSAEEKVDFDTALNGIVGLETSLAASLTALVHEDGMTIYEVIRLMSTRPSEVIGHKGGTLTPGAHADVVLFDPNEEWTVDPDALRSKSHNTPFAGRKLKGRVHYTIMNGNITYSLHEGA